MPKPPTITHDLETEHSLNFKLALLHLEARERAIQEVDKAAMAEGRKKEGEEQEKGKSRKGEEQERGKRCGTSFQLSVIFCKFATLVVSCCLNRQQLLRLEGWDLV